MSKNIFHHFEIALESEILDLKILTIRIQIFYMILNSLAHYLCITCVFILTTECTSLTVTMVITLRKFSSLVLSIFYFRHNFTFYHWIGTLFILIGTIIFTEIFPKLSDKFYSENVDKFYLNNNYENIPRKRIENFAKKISKQLNFTQIHYKVIKNIDEVES